MSGPAEAGTGGSPLGQKSAQQENPKSNFHLCQSRAPCATPRLVAHSWPVVEGFDRTMVVVYTSISSVGLRLGPLVPITISYPSNVPYPTTHLAAHTARITDNNTIIILISKPQARKKTLLLYYISFSEISKILMILLREAHFTSSALGDQLGLLSGLLFVPVF